MRLSSSEKNGDPDPKLAFGNEKLELTGSSRVEGDVYVEAFGSRITRPRTAKYGLMKEDFQDLDDWLLRYLNKTTEVHYPFSTMEPAFVLEFSPASGSTTDVSARLQAYGTVDIYFHSETGPAIIFEATNQDIAVFRQQVIAENQSVLQMKNSVDQYFKKASVSTASLPRSVMTV